MSRPRRPANLPLASRSETDLALRFHIVLEDLPPSPAPSTASTSSTSSTGSTSVSRVFTRAWKRLAGTLRKPVDDLSLPEGFVVVASPSRATF
ncbi:hypothetical protein EXIGLDRAFT_766414 [Exidia glandulosa HHB12029]|uniref:Uncharacterized protein n=1 Tax=Exidia glandulosa HHB12029 TaxID=1314781 RepID=A0A165JSX0_EXIGL|nr:hypothetical protein EXIGLDRAFT_766414 [Exidia glandulosa HHB12029]